MEPSASDADLNRRNMDKCLSTDMFGMTLPQEVLEIILSFIPTEALARCLSINSRWYHTLLSCPKLWHALQIDRQISAEELTRCLKYGGEKVTHLALRNQNGSTAALSAITSLPPGHLVDLDLTSTQLPLPILIQIAIQHGEHLNRLVLSKTVIPLQLLAHIIRFCCPNLKTLEISECEIAQEFDERLYGGGDWPVQATADLGRLEPNSPKGMSIEYLDISGAVHAAGYFLWLFLRQCPHLKRLRAKSTTDKYPDIVKQVRKYCPSLKQLDYQ